ncbi:hypothetical protein PILCRDRAFT_8458 [Piloderma croceum F 1598]|uniref:NADP-dependent oxidoreductase domain-containing protein n=1 Tax=Piloderma croceum (strain F 1598) TaxID=765440 RepID=A0A0C3BWQ2_PILCF|nr:hypothetical protein PILCRDRAFT_8458 [Piloderma croceum F 1598]
MPTRVPLILGAGSFGVPNTNTTRIHTLPEAQAVVDRFLSYGQNGIDTSRSYGYGTSEEFLGKLDLHGSLVDTKIPPKEPGGFAPDKIRASFQASLKALGPHKIRVFYLHYPDRSDKHVPFEDTLREINELHKSGQIQEFGLSNFFAWEVAEFVGIARANGWIQPTVYQGRYNALDRAIEPELIPCLRKYGIRFYAYSPLAGGLLAGRNISDDGVVDAPGSRWDPTASSIAPVFYKFYGPVFPVLRELKDVADKRGIKLAEVAHRWLQHHSALGPNDGVLLGVSNVGHVDANIKYSEGGPLPDDALKLLDDAWAKARNLVLPYGKRRILLAVLHS